MHIHSFTRHFPASHDGGLGGTETSHIADAPAPFGSGIAEQKLIVHEITSIIF